uniref:Jacalin-type lectin domain-containing protein n=1 Tax=Caenorhabditis tropicalis TaxID=1561998 RepID=A0A1I7TMS2_9PELO
MSRSAASVVRGQGRSTSSVPESFEICTSLSIRVSYSAVLVKYGTNFGGFPSLGQDSDKFVTRVGHFTSLGHNCHKSGTRFHASLGQLVSSTCGAFVTYLTKTAE